MGDNGNTTYWTEFTNEELENKNPFSKAVRVGERFILNPVYVLLVHVSLFSI